MRVSAERLQEIFVDEVNRHKMGEYDTTIRYGHLRGESAMYYPEENEIVIDAGNNDFSERGVRSLIRHEFKHIRQINK